MTDTTYNKGLELLQQLHGDEVGEAMVAELGDLSPEMVDMTIRWAFGEVYSREGLDHKTRELCIISACIMDGSINPQLRAHYASALKIGVSQQQIIEVILQMIFYAGMAKASNALRLLKEVIDENH